MKRDRSFSSILFDVIAYTFSLFVVLVTLYPVLHLLASSFSSVFAIQTNQVGIVPVDISLENYKLVISDGRVPTAFLNSLLYMAVGTMLNMILTTTMAYALSKKRLPWRKFFTGIVIFTMFFSGGLVPSFLLVRALGMYNTMWALILPGAISTYNLIVMRTFFIGQPIELEESAFIDGATDIQVFFRIVLPTSKAVLATITLFYMVGHWNSWFNAMIYLKDTSKYPLQLVLRSIVLKGEMITEMLAKGDFAGAAELEMESGESFSVLGIKYATLVISMAPMMIIYPFIQKYFTKGVMIGSIKG